MYMARKGKDQAPASSTDTPVTSLDTSEGASGMRGEGKDAAPARARTSGSFDREKASAAAQARWAKDRERKAAAKDAPSAPPGTDVDGQVIAALEAKAMQGDVPAARELREWRLRRDPGAQTSASLLALLTPEQRHILDGWLAAMHEAPA